MKYMMLVKLNRKSPDGRNYEAGMPPDAKLGAAMEKLMEECCLWQMEPKSRLGVDV